ncbi:MAG TPA: hypothetical protein VJN72_09985 [Gaiellales bacterium]|nr:hypothetical protein [Gaiellales bacterium]
MFGVTGGTSRFQNARGLLTLVNIKVGEDLTFNLIPSTTTAPRGARDDPAQAYGGGGGLGGFGFGLGGFGLGFGLGGFGGGGGGAGFGAGWAGGFGAGLGPAARAGLPDPDDLADPGVARLLLSVTSTAYCAAVTVSTDVTTCGTVAVTV